MPVIFATAILSLPQVLFSQIAHYNTTLQWIATKMNDWLNPASSGYYIISGLMIFFFSYFWVATMFQPSQIAEDLKRNGGYIPGIRPGPPPPPLPGPDHAKADLCRVRIPDPHLLPAFPAEYRGAISPTWLPSSSEAPAFSFWWAYCLT